LRAEVKCWVGGAEFNGEFEDDSVSDYFDVFVTGSGVDGEE
jgi:hypothetical protein